MTISDPLLVADFASENFTTIEGFPHFSQMSVMPVVAVKGDTIRPVGTCFAISNHGLVLTARHVIDDALGLANGHHLDASQWIGVFYAAEPGDDDDVDDLIGGILPVNKVHFNPDLDIAAMHLNLPVNSNSAKTLRLPLHVLGCGLPKPDELCFGMGYHSMIWSQSRNGYHDHEVRQSYSATRGKIQKLHTPIRDRIIMPFPCFEVSARYDGGMSGGPVLDKNGRVIGVICSSFGDPDEKGPISYASLVGPSLFLVVDAKGESGVINKHFLYDFVESGSVKMDTSLDSNSIWRQNSTLKIRFSEQFQMTNTLTA